MIGKDRLWRTIALKKNYLKAEADSQGTRAKAESLKRQLGLASNPMQMSSSLNQSRSKVPIILPLPGFVTAINVFPELLCSLEQWYW